MTFATCKSDFSKEMTWYSWYRCVQTCCLSYKVVNLVFSSPVNTFPTTFEHIISVLFLICVTVCSHAFYTRKNQLVTDNCLYSQSWTHSTYIHTRSTLEKHYKMGKKYITPPPPPQTHTHTHKSSNDGYLVSKARESWSVVTGYNCSKVHKCWIW